MGGHWMLLTALGFMLAGVVGICLWWVYGRILLLGAHHKGQSTSSVVSRMRIPLWRRVSAKNNVKYELVERREV